MTAQPADLSDSRAVHEHQLDRHLSCWSSRC